MTHLYYLFAAAGFLSGSILYSYLIPKQLKQIDIMETAEDHNPGAANAFVAAGIPIGLLCVILDILKGTVPVYWAARLLDCGRPLFALVLFAPVAGHAFSPFMQGHGGKAIAVAFGVLIGLLPMQFHAVVLAGAMIGFSLVLIIRPHRARVICAFCMLAAWTLLYTRAIPGVLFGVLMLSGVVIWKHRLREGAEEISISLPGCTPFYKRIRTARTDFRTIWEFRKRT